MATWSENVDLMLNFAYWLRDRGILTENELASRIDAWQRNRRLPPDIISDPYQKYWDEYLAFWRSWKRNVTRSLNGPPTHHSTKAYRQFRSRLKNLPEEVEVQWVFAPAGLIAVSPPRTLLMGVEGSDSDSRAELLLAGVNVLSAGKDA